MRLLNVCNSISKSDNEEMASNNNPIPNDEEIYDGTLKNIYIFKQKIHDYFSKESNDYSMIDSQF